MSLSYYYSQVSKLEQDIADLQRKVSDETRKELDKQKQIDSINRSINSSTSNSTLQSKQRQIQSYQSDLIRIQSAKADIHKRIADKTGELARKKADILKEEAREREKQKKEHESFQREQENFQRQQESFQRDQQNLQRKLQQDISSQKDILNTLVQQIHTANVTNENVEHKEYDFFISHATEDKESFVRPLAELLIKNGHKVWYDEFQLKVGDSLRKKIDEGLKFSKYGIAVLSRDFFKKDWPEYELNGLVAREMNGVKVILPIWHNVMRDEVLSFSPTLADKIALNTAIYSVAEIAIELGKLLEN